MQEIRRRLLRVAVVLTAVIVFGTTGYLLIGGGAWSVLDSLYMTVISVATVGYGELPGMGDTSRVFTIVVIFLGIGTFGWAASTVTAAIVESNLPGAFRRKRMRKQIDAYSGHVVVCGVGTTGRHVVDEMVATGTPVVAVDTNAQLLEEIASAHPGETVPFVVGDATEDSVLTEAGVERARGVVAALPDDKDNLYVVMTAHDVNPTARIVARAGHLRSLDKLRRAGAHAVVSPNFIGGVRIASEMLRPHVIEFLDEMVRDRDLNLRIEEVPVPDGSPWLGKSLRDTRIREVTDALVLAVRDTKSGRFRYNPPPDTVIGAGEILVVLGRAASVAQLRGAIATGL